LFTGESTDEILSRLLKEHEMRITRKLLAEDFLGDNDFDSRGDGVSPGRHYQSKTISGQYKTKTKRTKAESHVQEALKDKKDIESWLDQADPSLTVHELPKDPKISFRKNVLSKNNKTSKKDTNTDDVLSPLRRGMKEEVMERPAVESLPRLYLQSPFAKNPPKV